MVGKYKLEVVGGEAKEGEEMGGGETMATWELDGRETEREVFLVGRTDLHHTHISTYIHTYQYIYYQYIHTYVSVHTLVAALCLVFSQKLASDQLDKDEALLLTHSSCYTICCLWL